MLNGTVGVAMLAHLDMVQMNNERREKILRTHGDDAMSCSDTVTGRNVLNMTKLKPSSWGNANPALAREEVEHMMKRWREID